MSSSARALPEGGMRERILEQAMRLFAERGYSGTPIQEIADAVGVRKQSLLHHFANKDALREAVLEELTERWNRELPKLVMATTDPRARIDVILGVVAGFFSEDPNRARLLVREAMDRPEALKARLRQPTTTWMRLFRVAIDQGKVEGRIPEDVDPEAYILHIVHALLGGVACFNATGVLLDPEGTATELGRYLNELARQAKAGLYGRWSS